MTPPFLFTQTNQMQKLMEVYKSQISVTSTAPKTAATAALAAESPKTANIRPMTAPTSTTQVSVVIVLVGPIRNAQLGQLL